jgi:NADH-ubiquinone oxidoreductase chain 5
MEAPVPASALIHSATLVSAGIFILLKFNIIFINTNLINVIFTLGSITACYGGIVAACQTDMKKLLAYSTISHCGFIFTSIVLNNFTITITYLYLHGLFKALTFFCAGSIIKLNSTQDTRLMGSLKNQLFHIITLILAIINLAGLPFTFGQLYKELFLNFLIINSINFINFGMLLCGLLSGIVYSFKLIYYSCFDFKKGEFSINELFAQTSNYLKLINFNFSFAISFSFLFFFFFHFFYNN